MRSFILVLALIPVGGLILSSAWEQPQHTGIVVSLDLALGVLAAFLWARLSLKASLTPKRILWLFYLYLSATFTMCTIVLFGERNIWSFTAKHSGDPGHLAVDRQALAVCLAVTYLSLYKYQKLVQDSVKLRESESRRRVE